MIVARVRRTLSERCLAGRGDGVLLALSGGPDSAAMLGALSTLAQDLGLRLWGASINHGLRPDADRDVELARQQAQRCGVPFFPLALDLPPGADIQARARQARYQALHKQARALGVQKIAVGHTQDDQAETLLMRQLRGAGLRGLSGINPSRADGVVRPLIDCQRQAAQQYARELFGEGIARDPSNQDPRFERVRVRTQLLPALKQEDPRIIAHLADLADEARQAVNYLDCRAAEELTKLAPYEHRLPLAVLRELPAALLPALLRAWLVHATSEEPSRSHLNQLLACMSGRGEVWLAAGWRVRVDDRQVLLLEHNPK